MVRFQRHLIYINVTHILLPALFGLFFVFFYIKIKNDLPTSNKDITCNILKNDSCRLQYIILDGLRYDKFVSIISKLKLPQNSGYYKSITETPTITVPRLTTMFTGRKYKILDCLNVGRHVKEESDSLFDRINCSLFGDTTINDLFGVETVLKNDPYNPSKEKEIEIMRYLLKNNEENRIIHLNLLDKVGHKSGIYSDEYDNVLKIYISFLNDYITAHSDSLFIITSDHGCLDNGDHGGNSKKERSSMFCIIDPTINFELFPRCGSEIEQIDILPTVCDVLKISKPSKSRGRSLLNSRA
ncbi:GPI ethanolamine phosphate transferase 2 [Cucumispora dikerogammari]|nr:GPI ethanolamine phosphate transferase 2 [Cucumispora dikerogammari]